MAGTVWLIADRPEAVIQPGQPSAQQAAWEIPVPAGSTALQAAAAFASSAGFPVGTVARVLDPSKIADAAAFQTFELQSNWVQQ